MSRQPTNTSSPSGVSGMVGVAGPMLGSLFPDAAPTGLTPAGMGFTPNAPGMGSSPRTTAVLHGANTGTGISHAGLTAQDQEAARNAKIATIITMLSTRLGWVSQSGLERAAKRVKLEFMWEDDLPTAVGSVDKNGERTLSIAGNGVLVEVHFRGDMVQGVSLSYPEHGPGVGGFAAKGAAVLKSELQGTGVEEGFVALESFARCLEALARMDKLSGQGISAFDAVDGLRTALERIWELEFSKVREGQGDKRMSLEEIEGMVICWGSGRPKMHAGRRVGLSLQYWMTRHKVSQGGRGRRPFDMDIDAEEDDTNTGEDEEMINALVIECETQSPDVYPPIRVSDEWISTTVSTASTDLVSETSRTSIPLPIALDWQDPAPTYLVQPPPESQSTDDLLASTSSLPVLPSIRFVAKLSSPIILPLQIAMQILSTLNATISQESLQQHQQTTYETLLLSDLLSGGSLPTDPFGKQILIYGPYGKQDMRRHSYTLFPLQPVLGFKITELPFSHPRQIVNILPILRQWTLAGQMLRRCFSAAALTEAESEVNTKRAFTNGSQDREGKEEHDVVESISYHNAESDDSTSDDDSDEGYETLDDELAALLAPKAATGGRGNGNTSETQAPPLGRLLPVDISFSIPSSTGSPTFHIIYPDISGSPQTSHFSFEILGNGIINVTVVRHRSSQDDTGGDNELEEMQDKDKGIIKAVLEVSEDIGTTVAYLCSRVL